jgi:Holliday junction resolvase RusA-like endonuclease
MDGANPMSRPVRVYMEATYPPSASWPKWKQDAALKGALRHTGKPDADNLVKSVQDGLNGIVFIDDAQIFDLRVVKQYGEAPAVDVWIEEVSQPEKASDWKVDNRSQ